MFFFPFLNPTELVYVLTNDVLLSVNPTELVYLLANEVLLTVNAVEVASFSTPKLNQIETKMI